MERISLNNKFYDKNAVQEAITDFEEVCEGKIVDDSIEVELKPKEDVDNLKEEFCNYVLGLMKNRILV